jgi:tRNA(adenine34) deaminase
MVHARIEKVVFGAFDERTGVCGSCQDLSESKCFNHSIEIQDNNICKLFLLTTK